MRLLLITFILVLFLTGCVNDSTISGIEEIMPNESDFSEMGILVNESSCSVEGEYGICFYNISNAEIVIQLNKYADIQDLNGSYLYSSSHLRSAEGLISENEFGDQSRFSINHEDDYMGHLNQEGVYYYHLWITKDLYLIHITSKGSDIKEDIEKMGNKILLKFN